MLVRHLVDSEEIQFNLEFMSWLVREYGAPHAPPIPSLLHKTLPLMERVWSEDDQRSVFVWVEDEIAFLKSHCHMEDWHVVARPDGDTLPRFEGTTPVITYDPARCSEPGYFTSKVIMRLAQILVGARLDINRLDDDLQQQLIILAICYLGQGLTLAAMPPAQLQDFAPECKITKGHARRISNRALFGTALTLNCRRFIPDQLMATYGPVMDKPTYKRIATGLQQLKNFEAETEVMKMLCGKGEQHAVESPQYAIAC